MANRFSHSIQVPLVFVIFIAGPIIFFNAVAPSKIMIFGFTSSICLNKKGKHALISSGAGTLLPGGLHLMMLLIKTWSLRLNPQDPVKQLA